jgi:hypothetical protein
MRNRPMQKHLRKEILREYNHDALEKSEFIHLSGGFSAKCTAAKRNSADGCSPGLIKFFVEDGGTQSP